MQLFSRLGAKQSLDGLDEHFFKGLENGLCPGDAVEIYGDEGCGKTELLIHFCANCILPRSWKSIRLPGKEVKVIFVDTTFKFPLWRLVHILENRLRECSENSKDCDFISTAEIHEFLKSCLERLFIIYCSSSCNLAKSLANLEQILRSNPDICLLVVDSISEFYWTDRTIGGSNKSEQEGPQRNIVRKLIKYQEEFHLVVVVTKSAIMNPNYHTTATGASTSVINAKTSWRHDEYLSPEWNKFIKFKFQIKKLTMKASEDHQRFVAVLSSDSNSECCKFVVTDTGIKFI